MIKIALAGNPNVGKSTVFNALTGMKQHTGNWAGKTVENARGTYMHGGEEYTLVDIPGTYSLMASSVEEQVARDFICFGEPDLTVIVADATCLERNLNLVLQVLETTPRAVVCVNLLDEAKKKKIYIDLEELSLQLGVPVVGASARSGAGLEELREQAARVIRGEQRTYPARVFYGQVLERALDCLREPVESALQGRLSTRWVSLKLLDMDESLKGAMAEYLGFDICAAAGVSQALQRARELLGDAGMKGEAVRDGMVFALVRRAEEIFKSCVRIDREVYHRRDRRLDRLLTSKATGIPVMLALLGLVFWITISGANYPSELLNRAFLAVQDWLDAALRGVSAPDWLREPLVFGVFKTLGWVVSVMLPPMAIFFPLFTILEDSGYLPRVAFNMDSFFKKAGAHGKQALTTCMGFGCNACGVMGCRIIDSPRERLIALLTNNFVPCNGRFPTLIAIITMFLVGGALKSVAAVAILMGVILLGICMTLLMSRLLSKTVLKGQASAFALELPPYRRPQVGKVIVRSVFDRTLFVLGRAAAVAAPAGLVIWLMANVTVGDVSLLRHVTGFLDPLGRAIGLDGVIITAFVLGFPANEIVFPIIIMSYMSGASLTDMGDLGMLRELLAANGWTWVTAVCTMIFCLFHFPCATTLWTVAKETRSAKWTAAAFALPTLVGMLLCFAVATAARVLGVG